LVSAFLVLTAFMATALAALPAAAADLSLDDPQGGKAQDVRPQDVVSWDGFQALESPDGKVAVTLRMSLKQDWKVYASNLKFGGPAGFDVAGVQPPPSRKFLDPISGHEVDVFDGGEFTVTYTGAPRWTGASFPATVTYVGCTNVICLFPYTQELAVAFTPAATPAASAPAPVAAAAAPPIGSPGASIGSSAAAAAAAADGEDLNTKLAHLFTAGGLSFGMLLAVVFAGGLLSNLTPCVAPMVPITLRLLARQGPSPYASAAAYALGIVITYSLLGLVAALSGGMFGSLLASKAFNVAFAAAMIGLGVTMLGFGDLSKIQMLGNRLGSGAPSFRNTFLMGAGAGLVAAPCTGPILAALLAYTAKNNAGVAQSTVLLGTYSLGFALPYVALGGAAARVSSVKVSPRIQVAVKLLFTAVMFGLGLYYLRIPLYGLTQALKSHWPMIAAVTVAAGGVLTAAWIFVPNLANNKAAALLPTAILGIGIFSGWQWATVRSDEGGGQEAQVFRTESEAFAAAAASQKHVLVDTWAEWCEACKEMDAKTFTDPEVKALLARDWVILRIDFTETTPANDKLQEKYGVQSLPTLIMVPPSGQLDAKQAITGFVNAPTLINDLRQFSNKRAE
jgi:thiol:disulfide interchange protein DsbD